MHARRGITIALTMLYRFLSNCLHLVLVRMRGDYLTACFILDRLALAVGAVKRNWFLHVMEGMLGYDSVHPGWLVSAIFFLVPILA